MRRRLAPPSMGWHPPTGNPGSAAEDALYFIEKLNHLNMSMHMQVLVCFPI